MLDTRSRPQARLAQAAGHEAAHVIVARRLGCDVGGAQVFAHPREDGADGQTWIDFSAVDLVGHAAITCAGDLWEDLFGDLREAGVAVRGGAGSDRRWIVGHCDDFTRRAAAALAARILKEEQASLRQLQDDLLRRGRVTWPAGRSLRASRDVPREFPAGRQAGYTSRAGRELDPDDTEFNEMMEEARRHASRKFGTLRGRRL